MIAIPCGVIGGGLMAVLLLFLIGLIVAIPFVYRMARRVERDQQEIEQRIAEQRATIRRQRGRFKL